MTSQCEFRLFNKLRMDTKFIKLGFLTNYNQHDLDLLIKDFKMRIIV
jgi:hypothetical protein